MVPPALTVPEAPDETRLKRQPRRRHRSLVDWAESSPGRLLAVFTLIYVIAEVCSSSRRKFFFDELIATYLGDLPSLGQIWPLIAQGIELNPPLPFWIAWVVQHTVGHGEVVVRLPAIAGFWLMCICLYHFVRRRSNPLHGLIALLLPVFTPAAFYGTYARGYGLMLGLAAAALLCWQLAADGVRRCLALAGLAASIAGAVSCHYYAVYVVGALALGELVRTHDRKQVDPAVWAAMATGLSPLLAYVSLLRTAASGATHNFWVTPMPTFLYESYADLLGPVFMVFLLLLARVLFAGPVEDTQPHWTRPTVGRHEIVACAALAAMPLVIYAAAMCGPVPFFTRYVQPVVIGFSVLMTMFAYRVGGGSNLPKLTVRLLVWFCLIPWWSWQVAKTFVSDPPGKYVLAHSRLPLQSALPIVLDSESDFIELYHYGPPEVKARIFNLLDTDAAVRFRGSDTAQRSIRLAQTFRELHTLEYRAFIAKNREFLVVRLRPEGWVVQKLLSDQAKVELISLDKDPGYFVQDASVFRVTMPPTGP